ncbi:MAG: hypothetical protein LBQ22_06960 [Bacteroidales bacterium]|jgi:hypothetical protein|nr:hypothetical protein [Bacteroidales bacterium]
MSGFKIPLKISTDNIYQGSLSNDVEQAITDFIKLLISSSNKSFKPDRGFGFSLKNCRFENSDKNSKISNKKLNEKSFNDNCFARDLKDALEKYESRLKNPVVEMVFNNENQEVSIIISGNFKTKTQNKNPYKQEFKFHIW